MERDIFHTDALWIKKTHFNLCVRQIRKHLTKRVLCDKIEINFASKTTVCATPAVFADEYLDFSVTAFRHYRTNMDLSMK